MLRYLPGAPVKSFVLIVIVCVMQLLAGKAKAQSDPAPQGLPYVQSFSTFTGSTTTYPAGLQGWVVPGSLTTTVLTAAATGNISLFAGQTNASITPFVGDMSQKIGLLSGGTVNSLCLALNTTSVTSGNVQLIYTAATQGQIAGGYIDELDLQYRIGNTGGFTTIAGATYRNNALTTTNTAVTTANNPATIYVQLPAACTNQPVVELRWIPRNVSGSGTTHPGFSISYITAQANVTTDYYCKSAGNLDNISTWGTNTDGTGSGPSNFVTGGQVFHISNGNAGTLGGIWAVSGANSKVIVDGTDLTISTNYVTATIDVNAGRTLTLQNNTLPTLGNLNPLSTVIFSNLIGVVVPTVTPAYGNITFSNGTVALPTVIEKIVFAGNFSLQGTATFNGANNTLGYSLVSYGNNPQVINANGRPLTIWNLDIGNSNAKISGTVSLGINTTVNANDNVVMMLNGSVPLFADGGDTMNIVNNLDLGGSSGAYSLTGTVVLNSAGTGSANIMGNGSTSSPCVASLNNLVLNNAVSINLAPSSGGSTFTIKGTLTTSASATGSFNFQNNTVAIGGNFNYNNTNNALFSMGAGMLMFNGSGGQSYTSGVAGGNTLVNMTMNNSGSGLTLNSPLNISGTAALTNGIVYTGTNTLSIGASGAVTGANAASYVSGNLLKIMPVSGTTSMFYEVGDVSYAPAMLTFSSSINSGSVTVKSTTGTHPAMATSYVNTSNFVYRYWTVASSGVAPVTINLALSYNDFDITSGLGSNSGYIIREYEGGGWATLQPETNTASASAPLLPLASTVTGVGGTTFSGDYVAGAPDCTASAGTASVSPAAICGSGTSALSLPGATTNTGNTYQWQSSGDGSTWTNISGATNATYTTSTISSSTYYRSNVGCIPTTATVNSIPAVVTVNPLPFGISGARIGCLGQNTTLSDVTGTGNWSSSNTSIVTVGSATGIYTGIATGTANVTYTVPATGCIATAIITVNPAPTVPVVSPLLVSLCPSSPAQLVAAAGDTLTGTYSASSGGPLNISIPYNSGVTSNIPVNGIPTGAVITNVSVTFTDSNNIYDEGRDMVYNLKAPNGKILNLIYETGGSAPNDHFYGISVGSAGTVPQGTTQLVSGNLYIASLVNAVPSTAGFATPALKSNVTSWSSLYSVPNGNWTFIADDVYASGGGDCQLQIWSISISYVVPASVTWSPAGGLYTNSSASTAYTGTSTSSVYAKPTVTTTYNVTAAIGSCTSSSSFTAILNSPLYVPSISGLSTVCAGANIIVTDSTTGGTWTCTGAASIGSATGIVTGTSAGTAIITYTYTGGGACAPASAYKVITVNATPVVAAITGNANICYSGAAVTSALSDATLGGAWSSSNNAIATVNGSLGTVTGIAPGSSVISYTYSDGTCTTIVNTTVNIYSLPTAVSVTPPSLSFCVGTPAQLLTATGGNIPGSVMASSGPITVLCNTVTPSAASLTVSGVPTGATVTGIAVTFNISCSYDGDAQLNLQAPNGSVINLFSSGSGNNGTNFVNTTISSAGSTAIPNSGSGAPWTGVYAANAASNSALAPNFSTSAYSVTATSWVPLEAANPNGIWSLAGLDDYKDSTFTITSWSIMVLYSYQTSVTWAPLSGLYTNTSGTGYTGTATSTVYSSPAATTIYTISATNGTCSITANMTVSINAGPSAITGPAAVCQGATIILSDVTTGGTYASSNTIVANVGSDGTITPGVAGTSTITYSLSGSCKTTTIITVNPISPILGSPYGCIGGSTVSLSDGTSGGTWSSSNLSVAAIGSVGVITVGSIAGTSVISYMTPLCSATKTVTINPTPPAPLFTPSFLSICPTGPAQLIAAYADSVSGPMVDSTGPIAAAIFTVTPVTSNILVSGIPAGAVITDIRATINGHGTGISNSKEYNFAFNLMAPNGNAISLTNAQGSSSVSDFRYITFGSDGTTTIPSGAAPGGLFNTGVDYIANLASGVPAGITPAFQSNSTSWSSLYSLPNGTWTLIGAATYNPASGLDTLRGWSLSIYYYVPPTSVIWAPASGLFTDAGATMAYTGTSANSLYADPGATTVYTVTSTLGTCTSSSHFTASVNTVLYVPSISGMSNVCPGSSITLTDSTAGGNWSSASGNVIVGSSTGTVTGVTGGATAVITYTYNSGTCSGTATKIISINALPTVSAISGNANICLNGPSTASSLSDATSGGIWSSGNSSVATIDPSLGTVAALVPGSAVITYTYSSGCVNFVTTTLNALYAPSAISISPTSSSICANGSAEMLVAAGTQPGTTTATTGAISTTVNTSHDVVAVPLAVSLPTNATITDVAVTVNFSSLYLLDYQFNLMAPDGGIINLISGEGPSNNFSYFANTTISSVGTLSLSASSAPFTGTFAADTVTAAIPGYASTTKTWNPLFTTPNGNWTLIVYNASTFTTNNATLLGYNIKVDYTTPVTAAWASLPGLYTNSGATAIYSGTQADTVYTLPASGVTTYTATATNGFCASSNTAIVTVNPAPAAISGHLNVCQGLTTMLSSSTPGGTWSSNSGNVTVDGSGHAFGSATGTAIVTYTTASGCFVTTIVTVNPNPQIITGTLSVCSGLNTQLTDTDGGGIWSSNTPGNASVGSGTGLVAGITGGTTATITYAFSTGCSSSVVVTINPLPGVITGTLTVCQGVTTQLTDAGGGTWGSSNPGNATVSSSGLVTGVTGGTTSTITYTSVTGCFKTAVVTVNINPGNINGNLAVCQGQTTQLTDAIGGGTWLSGSTSNATISSSGMVVGLVGGTASNITYTLPTGCSTQATVTVDALPGIISGALSVCQGAITQLTDAGGGSWSTISSNVTINGSSGLVTGVNGGTTAIVTYTLPGGCFTNANVTVNSIPVAITGTLTVCQGLTTQLTDVGAGTWSNGGSINANVSGSGLVTGLIGNTTATITYTDPNTCNNTTIVTINALPGVINGTLAVCQGLTTQLTDAGGGTWSNGGSANASVSATGLVSGLVGNNTATITYSLSTGCIATAIVTINSLPTGISGSGTVCQNGTISLSDAGGGTWSIGFANITVGTSTGIVTGLNSGSALVTYTLSTGCYITATILVNPAPMAILGTDRVCVGSTTSLSDAGGGTWSSSNVTSAGIDLFSGLVTGLAFGTTTITYTLPVTGCYTMQQVTVNALPSAILGTAVVSVGYTTTLSDAGGGTWGVSNTNASVDAAGLVTGVATGTTIVSYTLSTGCYVTAILTINATPPPIIGAMSVCVGSSTMLSDAGAGTWSSSSGNITVGSVTGLVAGISAGTAVITFTFNAGGTVHATITVNGLPSMITGPGIVCQSAIVTLSDGTPGGSWSSTGNVSVDGTSGVVTGINAGTANITYTLPGTGCYLTTIVTISPLPLSISGSLDVCPGTTTNLSDPTPGGTWSSSNTNATVGTSGVVTGSVAGTAIITYTVGGCYTTDLVIINPLPGAISGAASVCAGLTTSLSDAGEGTWSSSNGNATVGSINGIVTGVTAGTSGITYTLSTGCVSNTIVTVNTVVIPSVNISIAPRDTICSGTSVLFTAALFNGGIAPVFQWSVNGSPVSGATSSIYNYTPLNADVVSAMATSDATCAIPATVADSITMTVITSDTSSVHVSVAPGDTVCQGSFAVFHAIGVNGGSAPLYLWSVNGAQVSTGVAYGYIPNLNDNVYCKLISNLQCIATDTVASNHIIMQVDTSYIPTIEILATPGYEIGLFQPDTFRAVVSNAGPVFTYQWFINSTLMPGATSSIFIASNFTNNDSVTCVVVSAGPCGYASFNSVKIKIIYEGVPQLAQGSSSVRLIPNPNKGMFTISGSLAERNDHDVAVEITDMLGQMVYKNNIRCIGGNIDEPVSLNNYLANGMYLLNLRSGNENIVLHFVIGR